MVSVYEEMLFLNFFTVLQLSFLLDLLLPMKGFSLLEVMLTLLIVSIGLLGITGMQLSGLKYANEAYFQSLATARLASMMERLRANSANESREREFLRWNNLNADLLPHGTGDYTCQHISCTVTIKWTLDILKTRSLSAQF